MNNNVTIVGGGSSAHILIPFLSNSGFKVNILTSKPKEWSNNIRVEYQSKDQDLIEEYTGELVGISDNPKDVIPKADFIILCMPVSKYRVALDHIAPYINKNKDVFLGVIYGQAGFNWMSLEIQKKYDINNIITFAIGLIPWVCRTLQYGSVGVTYGSKEVNIVAVNPSKYFDELNHRFLENICNRWMGTGKFVQSDNFLSLTLSVDNQIIHPSRCFGLYEKHEGKWNNLEDVPYFYRDYDDYSAQLLKNIDNDYTKIRNKIIEMYPGNNFQYMLDYLGLERLSYQSGNSDICESFRTSETLGAIKPPVIKKEGHWVINTNHRFFYDDINYGLCIAKGIAEKLNLQVNHIDRLLVWAQKIMGLDIIDKNLLKYENMEDKFEYGLHLGYNLDTIDDIVN